MKINKNSVRKIIFKDLEIETKIIIQMTKIIINKNK